MSTRKLAFSTIGAQALKTITTLVSGPLLARLLGPIPYGIIAPAQSVGNLGKLVAESGFAYHTVTAPEIDPEEAKDLHRQSMQLAFSVSIIAAIIAASYSGVPIWERAFRGIFAMVMVMMAGSSAVPYSWSQRIGLMKKLEWNGVIGQLLTTFAITIPLAYFGGGVYAASINILLPLLITSLFAWKLSGLQAVTAKRANLGRSYRISTLISNVSTYFAWNADLLVLTSYLSTTNLGVYSRGQQFASLPGVIVGLVLARIGLVTLSKSNLWAEHKKFLLKANVVTFGAFVALALLGFSGLNVMKLVFGDKFTTSPLGFAVLVLAQASIYMGNILDTYLRVRRNMNLISISHIMQAILCCTLLLVLRPGDLLMISSFVLMSGILRYCVVLAIIVSSAARDSSYNRDSDEKVEATS